LASASGAAGDSVSSTGAEFVSSVDTVRSPEMSDMV
jgi:hypothetical protein